MKKHKRGFTLIEVILFLGLTAALFAGVAAGVGNSVYQQRYSDAVQNYAEFLRTVYAQVVNTQGDGDGRSTNKAIYGKVITFRAEDVDGSGKTKGNIIKTYNLIGDLESIQITGQVGSGLDSNGNVTCVNDGAVVSRLKCLRVNVLDTSTGSASARDFKAAGYAESFRPRWGSEIQTIDGWNDGYDVFEAIVIVARSPSGGSISTYAWIPHDDTERDEVRKVIDQIDICTGEKFGNCENNGDIFMTEGKPEYFNQTYMDGRFETVEMDFCLNPAGSQQSSLRRDIRIVKGAHNASGINVLDEDKVDPNAGEEYRYEHNRCG